MSPERESITDDSFPFGQPWPQTEKIPCLVHKDNWEIAAVFNMYAISTMATLKVYTISEVFTSSSYTNKITWLYLPWNLWSILFNW